MTTTTPRPRRVLPRKSPAPPPVARDRYTVHLTALRVCRFCRKDHDITPAEPLQGTLEELDQEIPAAIQAEMEEQGWREGACPICADSRSAELHAEYHANASPDYRDEEQHWEGGDE